MPGGRRRRGPRGRTTRVKKNFVTPAQLRVDLRGSAPRGRFDPPRIVVQPWNTVTLAAVSSVSAAGIAEYSVASLTTLLQSQLGTNANPLSIRFTRVDVWTTASAVVQNTSLNFAMRASDLVGNDSSSAFFTWIEDFGTAARPAHTHFIWPQASQNRVFVSQQDNNVVIFQLDAPIAMNFVIHVHILWRLFQSDPIPSTRLRLVPSRLLCYGGLLGDSPYEQIGDDLSNFHLQE